MSGLMTAVRLPISWTSSTAMSSHYYYYYYYYICRYVQLMVSMFPYTGRHPSEFAFSGSTILAESSNDDVHELHVEHSSVNNETAAAIDVSLDSKGFLFKFFTRYLRIRSIPCLKITVACLIFHNLKKLLQIFIIFGTL